LLERYLFDLGYIVCVVENAPDPAQAVRTILQSGLAAIISGDLAVAVPAGSLITVPASLEHRQVAHQIAALIAAQEGGESQLTEGAGI